MNNAGNEVTFKSCRDCGNSHPLDSFPKKGKGRRENRCRDCFKSYRVSLKENNCIYPKEDNLKEIKLKGSDITEDWISNLHVLLRDSGALCTNKQMELE